MQKRKAAERERLARDVEAFRAQGGEIREIPFGILAKPIGKGRQHIPMTVRHSWRTG